jgi:hypothetical protein
VRGVGGVVGVRDVGFFKFGYEVGDGDDYCASRGTARTLGVGVGC